MTPGGQTSETSRRQRADLAIALWPSDVSHLYLAIAGDQAVGEPIDGREPASPQGE